MFSDFTELELALSDVINKLLHEISSQNFELNQVSRSCFMDTLACSGFAQSVASHGTRALRTKRLSSQICQYVTASVRIVGFQHDIHFDMCRRLIDELAADWFGQYSQVKMQP